MLSVSLSIFLYFEFKNDFFNSENVYEYNVVKFGADGSDSKEDASSIQKAIDQANKDGGGNVYIPTGTYNIESTIEVKSNVTLNLSKGAILLPRRNVNVIHLRLDGSIQGGTINTYFVENYDSTAVYLEGKDRFLSGNHLTTISNIQIVGKRKGNGNAIHFYTKKNQDCISWVHVSNLNIYGFDKAIYFKTTPVEQGNLNWINGNTFDQIHISDSNYGIYLDGHDSVPYEISGNSFNNIQIQLSERTKFGIYVKGTRNFFQGTIWDNKFNNAVKFESDSYKNQLISNVSKRGLIDLGKQNSIITAE
ncbi:glycosyl hydrolase family 28-related protein [Priestia filamentosa]|uniref:glycosyl hydrolase family 28-related protein n=1 Tax=Priestia filamentosa TaxID=1402861 RepID=UPI001C1E29A3|nr:glycosyl hydrolase family 28-related protein [Priestia filamentosa]